jgi:hypothetical protein
MTDWVLGVDASFHELTRQQAEELTLAGVAVWVQCLWTGAQSPRYAQSNLDIAAGVGLLVAGYGSLSEGAQDGFYHAEHTIAAVRPSSWDSLRFVATDVELDGIANLAIRQMVDRLLKAGKRRVVYSSEDAWVNKQGNPQDFEDCLIWNALWNGVAGPPLLPRRYGPWTEQTALGRQWSGGYTLAGAYVDRNTFRADLLKEEAMTGSVSTWLTLEDLGKVEAAIEKERQDRETGAAWIVAALAYHKADALRHLDSNTYQNLDDMLKKLGR